METMSEALERHQREKLLKIKGSNLGGPQESIPDKRESYLAKKVCSLQDCSPKVAVLSSPDSVVAEHFKMLRAHILFGIDHERPRTILVTSPLTGEGKTFVAVNLALSIALGQDEFVLLVDCDLRLPHVHEMLGFNNSEGLNEYLKGKKQLEDLIIRTKISKLSILPAGHRASNSAELLSSEKMRKFIEEVKDRYQDRFIIFDSTPTEITAEAKVLAKYMDGVVFVARAGRTPRQAIRKAIYNLDRDNILAVVFNDYDQAYKKYYKYYGEYRRHK